MRLYCIWICVCVQISQPPEFSHSLALSDIDRGVIEVIPSTSTLNPTGQFNYINTEDNSLDAVTPIINIVDEFVDIREVDAVVALISLSSTYSESRLGTSEVTLEVLSELFSFQGRAEVTVSVVLQNGRRVVLSNPSDIMLTSSNTSIVAVTRNFVEAVATGIVQLNVSWVVCGMTLGYDIISISAIFDEYIPEFNQNIEGTSVPEDAAVGTNIFTAFAIDEDFGPSVPVSQRDTEYNFALDSPSHGGLFSIHRTTGVVSLNMPLDRETVASYELMIEATDRSQRRLLQQLLNFQSNENTGQTGGSDASGSGLFGSGSGSGSGDMLTPGTDEPPPQTTSAPAPPTPSISRMTVSYGN